MAVARSPRHGVANGDPADSVGPALDAARRGYLEDPAGSLAEAIRCHEIARLEANATLCARALALQSAVSLHRGDLPNALRLAVEAERHAEGGTNTAARAEVGAVKAQLSFFTGSYAEALSHAEHAVRRADTTGDVELQIFVRRTTCVVFGNVAHGDWRDQLEELLAMTIATGNRWEEAISRNDLACYSQEQGQLEDAEAEIDRALAVVDTISGASSFARAIVLSTRADIRLLAGRPAEALDDAERSIRALTATGEANPYVLGVTVRAAVQARMALGNYDEAQRAGEGALAWIGDRVPQTRSLILTTMADALREAGRVEAAYEALARAAELERQAFRELSGLQLSLERATLEVRAARRETESLAAKNRQLAEAHHELERRTEQLEALQEQLRDQADRDWLTGLHNRRYLARELERLTHESRVGPLSLSVLDLDHFKAINDRYGHDVGDQVLMRVARLLCDELRDTDVIVRSGGEEFLFVMHHTDERAALTCCARIREAIRGEDWDQIAPGLTVTSSLGLASDEDPSDLEALVRLADQRLYEAKHNGRDCVVGPTGR
jgi:diguanylate cyclase (GGDEF)-like protein